MDFNKSNFKILESRLDFTLPLSYKKIVTESIVFQNISDLNIDFVPIQDDDIISMYDNLMEHFSYQKYRKLKGKSLKSDFEIFEGDKLYPFAQTEQGDFFCFYSSNEFQSPIIVYVPYDEDGFKYAAPSLEIFIYFTLLKLLTNEFICEEKNFEESFKKLVEESTNLIGEENGKQLLSIINNKKTDGIYLSNSELKNIYKKLELSEKINKDIYEYEY